MKKKKPDPSSVDSHDLKKRVLVTEDEADIAKLMQTLLEDCGYVVEVAQDGQQCLEMAKSFRPHLILLDIMMPGRHGIDILKDLKEHEETQEIGVIMCSVKSYKPEQLASKQLGAFDFIVKPFGAKHFIEKVQEFFQDGGSPSARFEMEQTQVMEEGRFFPGIDKKQGYLRFWGTRGSIPVSGRSYVRHGGNTSCLMIDAGEELLIFDAGTGLRELGLELATQRPRKIHLFVSHTHWDHIQGFPFFLPTYIPAFKIAIHGPSGFGKDLKSIFQGQLASNYFPVQMEDMMAKLEFNHLKDNPVEIGPLKIYWEYTHHPGAAVGFKIELNGKRIVYTSDNEFLKGYLGQPDEITRASKIVAPYSKVIDFISGADLLISEAQYSNAEYAKKIGWGHSSLTNACLFAKLGKAKKWIVTHHDPMHTDDFLQSKLILTRQIMESLSHPIEVSHAYDGLFEYL